jgi:hypothetical protein
MNQLHEPGVGGMGRTKFRSEIRNEKDHTGVLNSDGGIILILMLNKWRFPSGWLQWFLNILKDLGLLKGGKFLDYLSDHQRLKDRLILLGVNNNQYLHQETQNEDT